MTDQTPKKSEQLQFRPFHNFQIQLLLSSTLSNHHPSISSSQPHTSVTEFTFFFPLSPFLFSCFLSFSSKLCLPWKIGSFLFSLSPICFKNPSFFFFLTRKTGRKLDKLFNHHPYLSLCIFLTRKICFASLVWSICLNKTSAFLGPSCGFNIYFLSTSNWKV